MVVFDVEDGSLVCWAVGNEPMTAAVVPLGTAFTSRSPTQASALYLKIGSPYSISPGTCPGRVADLENGHEANSVGRNCGTGFRSRAPP